MQFKNRRLLMSYLAFHKATKAQVYAESMPSGDSYIHYYKKISMQALNVACIKGIHIMVA